MNALCLKLNLLSACVVFSEPILASLKVDLATVQMPRSSVKAKWNLTEEQHPSTRPQHAKEFDRYLRGMLSPEEQKNLKESCLNYRSKNIFCSSLRNSEKLDKWLLARKEIDRPLPQKVPEAIVPEYEGGRVKNWQYFRRARVQDILIGIASFPLEELRKLGKIALEEPLCPNAVSAAVAATLEEFLPDNVDSVEIADLYAHAAHCYARRSEDREHFLTRAGLLLILKEDFKQALGHLRRVEPVDAFGGRATYWKYRCLQNLGRMAEANSTLTVLLKRHLFSFHALVAAAEQKRDFIDKLLTDGKANTVKRSNNKAINDLLIQIETLRDFDYKESTSLLSAWTIFKFPHAEARLKLYIAQLGDPNLKVTTVPQVLILKPKLISKNSLELAYPLAFMPQVRKQQKQLDPFLLLALARKESLMDPHAISHSNAQGLLQLTPKTAQELGGASTDLLDPQVNINLGARWLNRLLYQLNGKLSLALAAYNAGEEAVIRWTKRFPYKDPVLFIDLIPYRETRDYIGYVLANYYWYRRIHGVESRLNSLQKVVNPEIAIK